MVKSPQIRNTLIVPFLLVALAAIDGGSAGVQARATGAVLLPPDQYAALPVLPRYRAFLPRSADLSQWFPEPGEQGNQPSCAAWAATYGLLSYYERRHIGPQSEAPLSPSYVYNQLAQPLGKCSSGLPVPAVLEFLKVKGSPPLRDFAYSEKSCNQVPDGNLVVMAEQHRIAGWKRLDAKQLDDVKGEIANGHPVVVAMSINHTFEDYRGVGVYENGPPPDEDHAMVVTGYDDQRQVFHLLNSWGKDWGDKGFGWVSYRFYKESVMEAYSVQVGYPVPPAPPQSAPEEGPLAVAPMVLVHPIPDPTPKPQPQHETIVAPPSPPLPSVNSPPPLSDIAPPHDTEPKPIVSPPKPAQVTVLPKPQIQPSVSLADAQKTVAVIGRDLRCAHIGSELSGDRLHINGYVASEEDHRRLAEVIASFHLAGSSQVNVDVHPWPLCEALGTFAEPLASPQGMSLKVAVPVLKAGQDLRIDMTTPSFPSFVYLSYVQADGQVVHLRRYGDTGNKPIPADTHIILGAAGEYRISGPAFGQEMLVAIASPLPLLAIDRPPTETEREYLTEFRLALLTQQKAKGKKSVSAAIATLVTEP